MRALVVLCLIGGCHFGVPTPEARVRKGPATELLTPLAPLPIRCKDVGQYCDAAQLEGIRIQTRMELELAGYSIIESEAINTELARRTTITQTAGADDAVAVRVEGGTWAELPLEEQRALLVSIGARGLLATQVELGMPHGMARQQTVTVRIAITRAADDALAWHSQCSVETGDFNPTDRAIELATRCALESAALW